MSVPLTYYKDISQGKSPADFATKCCYHPKKIWVYDSVTGAKRVKYVNCGKCLYCQDLKRNEFVTRMFLHGLDYKHVYFVTLTYGSYNLNVFKKHPFKNDWLETNPILDSYNSTHRPVWTPSLVIETHLQKFFKRLRKYTGCDCTYVAAGEVGDSYGRPHHHVVIYSNTPLTETDIRHAWSYKCVKTGDPLCIDTFNGRQKSWFWFNIGKVDFHDLVVNGTYDWKSTKKSDSNALHCFNYVAKYICKSHDKLSKPVLSRFKKAYNSLQTVLDTDSVLGKMSILRTVPGAFGDRIPMTDFEGNKIYDEYPNYVDELALEYMQKRCRIANLNKVNEHFSPLNPKNYETKQVIFNGRLIQKVDFIKFVQLYSQYFTCSKSQAIGRLYFEKEYSRFKQGNFALPKPFGEELAFPSYYYTLLARKESPFFFRKTTFNSNTLVKGNLPNVYDFFSHFIENKDALYSVNWRSNFPLFPFKKTSCSYVSGLIDPLHAWHGTLLDITFVDKLHRHHYYYDFDSDCFNGFVYNKHKRDFDYVDSISRVDMCLYIMHGIEDLCFKHDAIVNKSNQLTSLIDLITQHPDSLDNIENYSALRAQKSDEYKYKHLTADLQ